MISYRTREHASKAEDYLVLDPALNASEREGRFVGKSFLAMNLPADGSLEYSPARFHALLEGFHPIDHSPLVSSAKRTRKAFEIVFTPHKSVSLAALALDEVTSMRVRSGFDSAFHHCVSFTESMVTTNNSPNPTGNIAASAFFHETSRWSDPHLHVHLVVHNLSFNLDSGKWCCLDPHFLAKTPRLADLVFQRALHENLLANGIRAKWDRAKAITTIPDVPSEWVEQTSTARRTILAKGDILNGHISHFANLKLRPDKPPTPNFGNLFESEPRKRVGEAISCDPKPLPSKSANLQFGAFLAQQVSHFRSVKRKLHALRKLAQLHVASSGSIIHAVRLTLSSGFRRYSNGLNLALKAHFRDRLRECINLPPSITSTPAEIVSVVVPIPERRKERTPLPRRSTIMVNQVSENSPQPTGVVVPSPVPAPVRPRKRGVR